jgi:hypothetical protein
LSWQKRLAPTMRQTHVAGDKLFVDWAGDTVPIIDAMTGEVHDAHLVPRTTIYVKPYLTTTSGNTDDISSRRRKSQRKSCYLSIIDKYCTITK